MHVIAFSVSEIYTFWGLQVATTGYVKAHFCSSAIDENTLSSLYLIILNLHHNLNYTWCHDPILTHARCIDLFCTTTKNSSKLFRQTNF